MYTLVSSKTESEEAVSYAVYTSDPKKTRDTPSFPTDEVTSDDLLVKIRISKTTGLVEDVAKGDEGKIEKIREKIGCRDSNDAIITLVNTVERIKGGDDGRTNVSTYISIIMADPDYFKKANSCTRFMCYDDSMSNEERAKRVIDIVDYTKTLRAQCLQNGDKENLPPRFIFIPYGVKKSGIVGGRHIGAIIADLEAPKEKCIMYFDSSHDFRGMIGSVQKTVFRDDDTEMLDANGNPIKGPFEDDTGITVFGGLLDMMSCCKKFDDKPKIPAPINPKLQYSPQQTDCSYCVETLIHLFSFNCNFKKDFKGFDELSEILSDKEYGFESEFESLRDMKKNSLRVTDPKSIDLVADCKQYVSYRGIVLDTNVQNQELSVKKQYLSTDTEQLVETDTSLTQSTPYQESIKGILAPQPKDEIVSGLSASVSRLPQELVDKTRQQLSELEKEKEEVHTGQEK